MSHGLIVRAPNHLGDLVMALPGLAAAQGADILVARWLEPLLVLARRWGALPQHGTVLPLDRGGRGIAPAVRALRRGGYARGVLLTPSFSSALIFAAAGIPSRRGVEGDGRRALLTDVVPRDSVSGLHRSALYHLLVTGVRPETSPIPRIQVPAEETGRFRERLGGDRLIGLFPGSHAPSRRWPAERWAAVAERLSGGVDRVVVFGAPAERDLTARVSGKVAVDLGGKTRLEDLAVGLAACDVLITNDSGPMHLAAAVGTPTVALWGPGDPKMTGPLGSGHTVLQRVELPCVPCVRNECPRVGPGYVLPEADQECLRLITVEQVVSAVSAATTTG